MAQITNIGLENFRVFKKFTNFEISPITILTGPNSSGKSSFFKSLLLLKNNSSVNSLWKLDFSGSTHRLGTFKSIKNEFAFKDDTIGFNIEYDLIIPEGGLRTFSPAIINRPESTLRGVKNTPVEAITGEKDKIGLQIEYKEDGDNGKLISLLVYNPDEDDLNYLEINLSSTASVNHELIIELDNCKTSPFISQLIPEGNRNVYSKKVDTFEGKSEINVEITPFFENTEGKKIFSDDFAKAIEAFDIELFDKKETHYNNYLRSLLNRLLQPLLSILGYFEYIEAFRANTRRIYTNDSQGTSFNDLLVEFNSTKLSKEGEKFINFWLKKFKIADKVVFEKIEGVANTIYLVNGNKKTLLADLGFGITQFLPILMKIGLQKTVDLKTKRIVKPIKKLILLEEPETNLHPKFQSLVAEMIADAISKFEVRFIIETHSEYFIRKLQVLTVKKEISTEDTSIYYINDLDELEEDEEHVQSIKINEDGSLDGKFGNGFFDEANSLIGKIWDAR